MDNFVICLIALLRNSTSLSSAFHTLWKMEDYDDSPLYVAIVNHGWRVTSITRYPNSALGLLQRTETLARAVQLAALLNDDITVSHDSDDGGALTVGPHHRATIMTENLLEALNVLLYEHGALK